MTRPFILMAGGGTGGHVFPMIAVADALMRLMPSLELGFVGTRKGLESRLVPERGYALRLVDILPLRGGGITLAGRGLVRALSATLEERRVLGERQPRAVFSIGGYAAGPVAAAALSLGIPVAVMEPNSVIGLANRLLAPFVQRAYTAFATSEGHFKRDAVLRTGVPIRSEFVTREYRRHTPPRVLVLGGSQGASSLNQSLPGAFARLGFEVEVVHQCGLAHQAAVQESYERCLPMVRARVVPFIDDMPRALAEADLVVSRSGASAVSEICAVGRPSLLIPYPYAAGDHQKKNANELVRSGAAVLVETAGLGSVAADQERLGFELARLLSGGEALGGMARAAARLGKPDAALDIARDLLGLAGLAEAEVPTSVGAGANAPDAPAGLRFGQLAEGRLG